MGFELFLLRTASLLTLGFFVLVVASCFRKELAGLPREEKKFFFLLMTLTLLFVFQIWKEGSWLAALQIFDGTEYALSSVHLWCDGRAGFFLGGEFHPSRYPPFFSAIFLAPFQIFSECSLEFFRLPILFCLFGIVSFSALVLLRHSRLAALLTVALLIFLPHLRFYSSQLLTEIPFAFLYLLSLRVLFAGDAKKVSTLSAGFLVALGLLLRPQSALLFLPHCYLLLKQKRQGVVLFSLPLLFAGFLTVFYGLSTFGKGFGAGYEYWLPIPYKQLSAVFSPAYFFENAANFAGGSPVLPLFLFASALLPMLKPKLDVKNIFFTKRELLIVLGLSCLSHILLHLFYFYSSARFFIPIEVLLALLLAYLIAVLAPPVLQRISVHYGLLVIVVICLCVFPLIPEDKADPLVPDDEALVQAQATLPQQAILLSSYNPALLSYFFPKARIIPFSREMPYANSFVLPVSDKALPFKISDPYHFRDERLLKLGAKDVFPLVVEDEPGAFSLDDRELFLFGDVESEALKDWKSLYGFRRLKEGFYRLESKAK